MDYASSVQKAAARNSTSSRLHAIGHGRERLASTDAPTVYTPPPNGWTHHLVQLTTVRCLPGLLPAARWPEAWFKGQPWTSLGVSLFWQRVGQHELTEGQDGEGSVRIVPRLSVHSGQIVAVDQFGVEDCACSKVTQNASI